jgi:AraC family transcriptional regulator of adaptative response/methylated-DNA-[protein]-cysteine methyltransferase
MLPMTSRISRYASDDERWATVERRDRRADGAFYCAVRTTGVYCRPSCAGRPLRRNVSFYETRGAARQAGFRPCKRCRPDEPVPSAIRFACGATSLGTVLVAATPKGIAAVLLGDDRETVQRDLRRRFPKRALIGDESGLADRVATVVGFVEAPSARFAISLDPQGTPFQQKVWAALRAIGPGTTVSYTEIAARIGLPKASRAVAQACSANPIAVIVPCHRVVRSNGDLSGYLWGVERKRALLAREARA